MMKDFIEKISNGVYVGDCSEEEPDLYHLIFQYYFSHFDYNKATLFTEQYVEQLESNILSITEEENN